MKPSIWRVSVDTGSPGGLFQIFCNEKQAHGFADTWIEQLEAGEPNQYLEIKGYSDTADRAPVRQLFRSGTIQAVLLTRMTYE